MKGMRAKVADHGREHVVKGDGRVDAQDQVVEKDKGGHGSARLGLFGRLGVGRLGNHTGDLADLGVEETDRDAVSGSNGQGRLPVHEEIIVFGKGDAGRHGS